jgi:hypothetical protein
MVTLDRYTLMGRVLPAAVVALPIVVSAYVWAPFDLSLVKGAFATTVFAAIAFALSQFTGISATSWKIACSSHGAVGPQSQCFDIATTLSIRS